jgi:hypothetical protein
LLLKVKIGGRAGVTGTHDTDEDEPFDPRAAAHVLADAGREAKRELSPTPALITVGMAAIILGAYIAMWLSTKDQHPYTGPSPGVVGLVYVAVAVSIALSATCYRRAVTGVSGPSVRQRRLEGVAIGVSYLCSPLIQGAMKHYGAGDSIVYGVIPAAGPLILVGTTILGVAVSKEDWPQFGSALAVVVGGIVALFVGPSGAWLAAGAGLFTGVVAFALTSGRRSWIPRPR